jgi:hypothetical protein
MGNLYSLLPIMLLWANSVVAQGTMLFTWHGDSNYFQASFEVPSSELQPGVLFGQMFLDTMSVTNPVGQTYHGGDNTSAGSGSFIPWGLTFQLNDFQRSTEAVLHGGFFAGSQYRTAGDIREMSFSGASLWSEQGYWTFAQIPEPCSITLLCCGGVLFLSVYSQKQRR